MEVIAVGKGIFATTPRDLRSHHLGLLVNYWFVQATGHYTLDIAILSGRHPKVFGYPDDTLDSPLMGQTVGVFQKIWRAIWPVDVENPGLLLLATGKEMGRSWR